MPQAPASMVNIIPSPTPVRRKRGTQNTTPIAILPSRCAVSACNVKDVKLRHHSPACRTLYASRPPKASHDSGSDGKGPFSHAPLQRSACQGKRQHKTRIVSAVLSRKGGGGTGASGFSRSKARISCTAASAATGGTYNPCRAPLSGMLWGIPLAESTRCQ